MPAAEGVTVNEEPRDARARDLPFGTLLKRHRLAAGLTHAALAQKAALSARASAIWNAA